MVYGHRSHVLVKIHSVNIHTISLNILRFRGSCLVVLQEHNTETDSNCHVISVIWKTMYATTRSVAPENLGKVNLKKTLKDLQH